VLTSAFASATLDAPHIIKLVETYVQTRCFTLKVVFHLARLDGNWNSDRSNSRRNLGFSVGQMRNAALLQGAQTD